MAEIRCEHGHLRAEIAGRRLRLYCPQCSSRSRSQGGGKVFHEWEVVIDGGELVLRLVADEW